MQLPKGTDAHTSERQESRQGRLVVISNRLPFTAAEENGKLQLKGSVGGVASGLGAYLNSPTQPVDYLWLGWPGSTINSPQVRADLRQQALAEHHSYPVFLSEGEMEDFYHGFCNKIIWPLFHYFPSYVLYDEAYWAQYKKVNEAYCAAALEVIRPGDVVWVHDYHLMLLPALLRQHLPDAKIGFFLHIPFPSLELFRLMPREWGTEILQGLLGADLVGFHTHNYTQYFLNSVLRMLGYHHDIGQIQTPNRTVRADAFPMGIDFEAFQAAAASPQVQATRATWAENLQAGTRILSIDRLDYTKGIINRLQGYALFLENYPQWQGKVSLALVLVPSRIAVEHYQQTRQRVEELVGRINGRFGRLDWVPIIYQYRALPFTDLVALYGASEVALVTPLRDGMNLIAKEYVASRIDKTGVLILSEMAGAAEELGEALLINPNNHKEIAVALNTALTMPRDEQIRRNGEMQIRLRRYNLAAWAWDFLRALDAAREEQASLQTRVLTAEQQERMAADYAGAHRRLLMLDYDGTLAPLAPHTRMARPSPEVMELLRKLAEDPTNKVVVISGRDRQSLQEWLGSLPVNLAAEHGAWQKPSGGEWRTTRALRNDWKPVIRAVLERYADRLPGSRIEEKDYSLAWHFRQADPELGPFRAKELLEHLVAFTANLDVQVLRGSKVIEVKSAGVNKGSAAAHWAKQDKFDFVLAVGDDWTDEDLFRALPERAYTVKVGLDQSYARFSLPGQEAVLPLLWRCVREADTSRLVEEQAVVRAGDGGERLHVAGGAGGDGEDTYILEET